MKIYATSNSLELAEKILSNKKTNFLKTEKVHVTKVNTFADGELNVTFEESIRGQQIVIIAQVEMPYKNLFELFLTLDAARRSSAKEIIVVIPYLPHSRQERRDDKRSPITSRLIADMLQNAGADRVISMDMHTTAIEGNYTIPFDKLSPFDAFLPLLKEIKEKLPDVMLVSPDFGFMKKMEKYQSALNIEMAVIDKNREKANEIKEMKLIGDVMGKHVIIIDDIIDTAGTLIKASDLVMMKGAGSVTVFATHAVLSQQAIPNIMKSSISKIYITNTINRGLENLNTRSKFEIVDVSNIFASALNKIKEEE